jgi:hypothetical protein
MAKVFETQGSETQGSDITFVCCVESGSLEPQTIRMVESVRRYGGKFATAPVIAVTPRFGPPLSKATLQSFDNLGVTHLRPQIQTHYPWFKFLNKPLALVAADELITSEAVGWLDSDLLVLDEPEKLALLPSEDFLGFPVESKEMGTTGSGDPYEPLWQEFCRIVGIDIEDLPWTMTAETDQRVRLYFNGGIFVYRRSTGFAQTYLEICLQLLDSQIGTKAEEYNVGIKEMSAIGFAVIKMGLVWRSLPYSHDYVMLSRTHQYWYKEELLKQAKIVHYHDSMWLKFWPVFLECLHKTHPEVEKWLATLGPLTNQAPWQWRLIAKMLKSLRVRAETTYNQNCRMV